MNKLFIVVLLIIVQTGCSKDPESQTSAKVKSSPGAAIVKANCKVCHAQGINGAPVIGNKKMWSPRLKKGVAQLVKNASQGVGLMPAKGGNTELTEEEMTQAVNYLVEQVK